MTRVRTISTNVIVTIAVLAAAAIFCGVMAYRSATASADRHDLVVDDLSCAMNSATCEDD